MTPATATQDLQSGEDSLARLGRSFETFQRISAELEEAYERLHARAERIDLELAETNRRLATILAHLPVGVVVTDDGGRITHANPTAAALLGRSEDEVRGRPVTALRTASGERLAGATPPSALIELVDAAGRPRRIRVASAEVPGPDGARGRILTLEDHTEAEALRAEVHRLDQLAALGEMSARLAHQIRNPLNGMQGFAGLLARGLQDRPTLRAHAEKVLEGARDLNRIVSNMLAFARPARGTLAPCRLVRTVQAATAWLEGQLPPAAGIRLRVRHDDRDVLVLADRFSMEEALRNLLLNAVEAMPGGGLLRVRSRARGSSCVLTVADTGPGVPPALRDRLFEPFVTGRERGTGLGLAIVRSVVESCGGELALRPSGRGARFRIRLPLARPEEEGGQS